MTKQKNTQNMDAHARTIRNAERGNVFFTLFGAVAILGVLGAGIVATMRGPLSTMVEVNRQEQAKAELRNNASFVLLSADDASCEGAGNEDGYTEGPQPDTSVAKKPVGGGGIPASIAAVKNDPWGTPYGYCAWDHGPATKNVGCGDILAGNTSTNNVAVAILSAGPDREFQTDCGADPAYLSDLEGEGDDLVNAVTYAGAVEGSDGLWTVVDADTAGIEKDIQVGGDIVIDPNNTGTGQLQLGAQSMLLPTQAELPNCNAGNNLLPRVNDSGPFPVIEICDGDNNRWIPAGSLWSMNMDGEIYFNTDFVGIGNNNPTVPLEVTGNTILDGQALVTDALTLDENLILKDGKSIVWDAGNSSILGDGQVLTMSNVNSEIHMKDDSIGITGDTTIQGKSDTTGSALSVQNSKGDPILVGQNDGNVAIGAASSNDRLDVAGVIDSIDGYKIDDLLILNVVNSSILLGGAAGQNVTGGANVILGDSTAGTLDSGSNNIVIGYKLDVPTGGTSNYINIGDIIHADMTSNVLGIGYGDTYDASTLTHTLSVNGSFYATGTGEIDGNLTVDGNIIATDGEVNVDDDFEVSGDIYGTDISASEFVFVDGAQLGPPEECAVEDKLSWDDTSGWSCIDDQGGTGSGGTSRLDEVLNAGNDADAQDAENFDQVGANQFCNADLTVCFDPSSAGGIFEVDNAATPTLVRTNNTRAPQATVDFVFGSSSLDNIAGANDDSRLYFDKSKSAFRAGQAINNSMDASGANVGLYSVGFGRGTRAGGEGSIAGGTIPVAGDIAATGQGSFAWGIAEFSGVSSTGKGSLAFGRNATAGADYAVAIGDYTSSSGTASLALGRNVSVSGTGSFSFSSSPNVSRPILSGNNSAVFFLGDHSSKTVSAANTFAILGGKMLIDPTAPATETAPSSHEDGGTLALDVEGYTGSIKYCDNQGNNCFEAEDVATDAVGIWEPDGTGNYIEYDDLLGGARIGSVSGQPAPESDWNYNITTNTVSTISNTVAIGSATTATGGESDLALDITGAVGADEYCDSDGDNCFLAGDVGTGVFEVTGSAGSELVRQNATLAPIATSDFVFGATSLTNQAGTSDDSRMYFDKSKGAFRSGHAATTQWDASTVSVGSFSTAFGYQTIASGDSSFAAGSANAGTITASGTGSIAMGYAGPSASMTASAQGSIALGFASFGGSIVSSGDGSFAAGGANGVTTTASGAGAISMGSGTTAAGNSSAAFGQENHAGSFSEFSIGRFSLNTAGTATSWVTTDTLFEIGNGTSTAARANAVTVLKNGNVGISTAAPSVKLSFGSVATAATVAVYEDNNDIAGLGQGASQFRIFGGASGTNHIAFGKYSKTGPTFTEQMRLTNAGYLGIGDTSPDSGTGGQLTLDVEGAIGGTKYCDENGNNCFTAASASGSAVFEVTGGAGTELVRQNAALAPIATSDFVFGATSLTNQAGATDDARMYFDKSKGAFRAGTRADTGWDAGTAAVGSGSAAFGSNTFAGGQNSMAWGDSTAAYARGSTAFGTSDGFEISANGIGATAFGYAPDNNIQSNGPGSVAFGLATPFDIVADGFGAVAFGHAYLGPIYAGGGYGTIAFGTGAQSINSGAIAIGSEVLVAGAHSIGIALHDSTVVSAPTVSSEKSFVIFSGDQSGYDFMENNKFAVIGAEFQIDDVGSSANKGCIRYNSATTKLQFSHDCSSYSDMAAGSSAVFEVTGGAGSEVVRQVAATAPLATSDFLFGATTLDYESANNNRFFFDKSKAAFRAGSISGTNWNDANRGSNSAAFGKDTIASGAHSMAWNDITRATGTASTAWGNNTAAEGNFSTAFGLDAVASGLRSIAIGLGDSTGSGLIEHPQITSAGIGSIAFFMGDQKLVDVATPNTMAILGGSVVIDPAAPATQTAASAHEDTGTLALDVTGYVGATKYCDASGNNCFAPTDVGGSSVFEVTGGAGTELVRQVAASAPIATSDFVFGSTQLANIAGTADDARMYFDKSLGAFRAGGAGGTEFDAVNVGLYSAGFGTLNVADGDYSFVAGQSNNVTSTASHSAAFGAVNTVSGGVAFAIGSGNLVSGSGSFAGGQDTISSGSQSFSFGASDDGTVEASGDNSFALGFADESNIEASGVSSFAIGYGGNGPVTASGLGSIAIGDNVEAAGDGSIVIGRGARASDASVVIGLGLPSGTAPVVSEPNSLGIFMGDQAGYNFDLSQKLALIGGEFVIDDVGSSANKGCIRYNSATTKLQFSHDCSSYSDMAAGSSSVFEVTGGAGTELVRQVAASAPIATADFVFGGTALTNQAGTDDDNRMFFDKSKAAFRAGAATGTQWNEATASVGSFSAAFGRNSIAQGTGSLAFGYSVTASAASGSATGDGSIAGGYLTGTTGLIQSTAAGAIALGNASSGRITSSAAGAIAMGSSILGDITASGIGSVALGSVNAANDLGSAITASGRGSMAWGYAPDATSNASYITASGIASTAFGTDVGATANYTLAIGLGDVGDATAPVVSAANSMAVFMGNQSGVSVNASNVAAFLGTSMIINPDTTSASPAVPATTGAGLELHVVGDIGATQYCDTAGANCFTPANAGGTFEVTGSAGSELVRQKTAVAPIATADFLFGGTALDNQAGAGDDIRMFFDKSKGAFRAGYAPNTVWDAANVGDYSAAFGYATTASGFTSAALGLGTSSLGTGSLSWGNADSNPIVASGDGSAAFGLTVDMPITASGIGSLAFGIASNGEVESQGAGSAAFGQAESYNIVSSGIGSLAFGYATSGAITASGAGSAAWGDSVTASGALSTAFGQGVTAGPGNNSIAMGYRATASADRTFAVGLGAATGTYPIVSGAGSMAIFMGDQSGYNFSATNKLALIGGEFQIDDNGTSASKGCIRYRSASVTLQFSHDCSGGTPTYVELGTAALSGITAATKTNSIDNAGFAQSWDWTALKTGTGMTFSSSTGITTGTVVAVTNSTNDVNSTGTALTVSSTGTSNAAVPLLVVNAGTGNSFRVNDDGTTTDANPFVITASGDLAVGSTSIVDQAGTSDDYRLTFNAANGAFRAGYSDNNTWTNALIGPYSTAFGIATTASGTATMAWGFRNAVGGNPYSTAWGMSNINTGYNATVFGFEARVSGTNSLAIGLGDPPGASSTFPIVSANNAIGIFFGDQSNVNINTSNVMAIMGGRLGVNVASPGAQLQVTSSAAATIAEIIRGASSQTANLTEWQNSAGTILARVDAAGQIGIGVAPSVALDVTGDIEYTGTIADVSDRRLKTDIKPLEDRGSMLEKIGRIDTYSFVMKDDDSARTEFGVMAQDMQKIFPELVTVTDDEMGTLTMNYMGLIAPMIKATQELDAQNKALKAELAALKSQQENVHDVVAALSSQVEILNRLSGQSAGKASFAAWPFLTMLSVLLAAFGAFFIGRHYRRA